MNFSIGRWRHHTKLQHQTNQQAGLVRVYRACYSHSALVYSGSHRSVAVQRDNFRRLLRTVEALSDLGPELTAGREFSETARVMLSTIVEAGGAREGAIFTFSDKPSLLTSLVAQGFNMLPEPALIPLLPKHVHALTAARGPMVLNSSTYEVFLSSNGNGRHLVRNNLY